MLFVLKLYMPFAVIDVNQKQKGGKMRRRETEAQSGAILLSLSALLNLENKGYKYVQVKGLTMDRHYDYVEPHSILLVPIKELPKESMNKDIYEPVNSDLLRQWCSKGDDGTEVFISKIA
jgi:hypothetical protein